MESPNNTLPIPEPLYKSIFMSIPVACIDILICSDDDILLGYRRNPPMRSIWWLIGGMIFKGESFEETIDRKLKEEAGIEKYSDHKFLFLENAWYPKGKYNNPTHTINLVFSVQVKQESINLPTDSDLAQLEWFHRTNENFHPYVKKAIDHEFNS